MGDSILTSIKKLLGITKECDHFDADIIMHINSVLMTLEQLGVGPVGGFRITGPDETWKQLIPPDMALEDVKSYIFIKVKLLFDPPMSSAVLESMTRMAAEFEWRINVAAETNDNSH